MKWWWKALLVLYIVTHYLVMHYSLLYAHLARTMNLKCFQKQHKASPEQRTITLLLNQTARSLFKISTSPREAENLAWRNISHISSLLGQKVRQKIKYMQFDVSNPRRVSAESR